MKARTIILTAVAGAIVAGWGCGGSKPKSLMEMRRDSGELQMNEGVIFLNNGRYDEAEQKLLEALQKNPNLLMAMNALGITYTYKRDYARAVETFEKLLTLNPQFYDAYNSLGAVYMELGKYDLAKEKLLIAANAKDYLMQESAYSNLAILEMRNQKIDAALRYIEKGLALNNRYPTLYTLRGVCLEMQGKNEEALESHEKGLSLTKNPLAQQLLAVGRLCKKMNLKKKALDYLEQALSRTNDPLIKEEITLLMKEVDK